MKETPSTSLFQDGALISTTLGDADLFIETNASHSGPIIDKVYSSSLHCNLDDILNIFNIITQEPVSIGGTYESNGLITYHMDDENTVETTSTGNANLSGLMFNTWTKQVESGAGTYSYILQNDTGSFSFDGVIEVTLSALLWASSSLIQI